jgi:hypothetical protein
MIYGVDFVRLEDIKKGDLFLYMGRWRRAVKIVDKKVHYRDEYAPNGGNKGIVAASKQFVEIPKKLESSAQP